MRYNMKEKKYIVEMTDDELKRFKKLLKENKKSENKKKMDETLLTMARFHVFKIESFHAAKVWARGAKWSLSIIEDAYNEYTKDYDYYIIQCGDTSGYAILTNKDTHVVREIRNKRMERMSVDELLEEFNGEGSDNKLTMEDILNLAIVKE